MTVSTVYLDEECTHRHRRDGRLVTMSFLQFLPTTRLTMEFARDAAGPGCSICEVHEPLFTRTRVTESTFLGSSWRAVSTESIWVLTSLTDYIGIKSLSCEADKVGGIQFARLCFPSSPLRELLDFFCSSIPSSSYSSFIEVIATEPGRVGYLAFQDDMTRSKGVRPHCTAISRHIKASCLFNSSPARSGFRTLTVVNSHHRPTARGTWSSCLEVALTCGHGAPSSRLK